ncbi:nuclear transport factor 2 family protein [Neorhizobium alkalisoli]|uniref:nuclear transport factor 2 family protein n=1 Tax=Neorhizobium alkalisoli TaxID=528178 RepID=UPI000CFA2D1A|nr:nuclear transport factor 2 family protein [Neorhizobium alkalisoli]
MDATCTPSELAEMDRLRAIEHRRLQALVEGDMETALPLHSPDFQLITPIGMPLSRDQYLGAISQGAIKYLSWQPQEITVRLHQDVALIRYRAALEVIFNGHRVPLSDYWHTDTYEYHDGRWMIVWSHATAIQ